MNNWPDDDDGDALRALEEENFDFRSLHNVDFQINFDKWPPPPLALQLLARLYGQYKITAPDEEDDGYVEITKRMLVTYEEVVAIQEQVTTYLKSFGGSCEWWEVQE